MPGHPLGPSSTEQDHDPTPVYRTTHASIDDRIAQAAARRPSCRATARFAKVAGMRAMRLTSGRERQGAYASIQGDLVSQTSCQGPQVGCRGGWRSGSPGWVPGRMAVRVPRLGAGEDGGHEQVTEAGAGGAGGCCWQQDFLTMLWQEWLTTVRQRLAIMPIQAATRLASRW
jgi:hypothetical protein